MGEKIGKATEVVGYATGDREVEARGRVEERGVDPDAPAGDAEDAVAREEARIRAERGEHRLDR